MTVPYYPYRSNKIASILITTITLVWGLLLCFMHYASITLDRSLLFLFALYVLFSIWAWKTGFATSKTHITYASDCIHIYEKNVQHSIAWNDLSYRYESHDFKGHKYLILSHCELQKSAIKKVIRQSIHMSRVCFDDCYVIFLDWGQSQVVQELEQCIDANIGRKANKE